MDRKQRAKQFAPFDALSGLHQAIKIKEFEHESVVKGDLSETQAECISNTMMEMEQGDVMEAVCLINGHEYTFKGFAKIFVEENKLLIDEKKIDFSCLCSLRNCKDESSEL